MKYWLPPAARIACSPLPVRAIVFPRFGAAAAPAATPLGAYEALARLMQAPTRIGVPLSEAAVGGLAGWLESCPAYELAYDDAEAAAAWVARLLAP